MHPPQPKTLPIRILIEFYHNWWQYRHLDNIHLVHFNNLLENLRTEIEHIAGFLEVKVDNAAINTIARAAAFSSMKKNSRQLMGEGNWMIKRD